MNYKIVYKIHRGEKETNYTAAIPEDLFSFLTNAAPLIQNTKLISDKLRGQINNTIDNMINLYFECLYEILERKTGISHEDIDELDVVDEGKDYIYIVVDLN